jgi:anaerobic selenocysteine-containing dehydrogenase
MADGFARLHLPQPYLPFAAGNFPTTSGKCEFYSERMARDGYDPVPSYTSPHWQAEADSHLAGNIAPDMSLVCISPPAHSYLNTSFGVVDRLRKREGQPIVRIHPHDAGTRGIATGDEVRVANELGSVLLRAEVTDDIVPGTVLAPGVWWSKHSPDGCNINQVTPQAEADMGAGALFYDTRVTVEATMRTPQESIRAANMGAA